MSSRQISNARKAQSKVSSENLVGVSVKPLNAANDNLIDQARKVWQPRRERDLCDDDATQIIENVVGFFSILAEWSISETAAPANDRGESDSSRDEGASHAC